MEDKGRVFIAAAFILGLIIYGFVKIGWWMIVPLLLPSSLVFVLSFCSYCRWERRCKKAEGEEVLNELSRRQKAFEEDVFSAFLHQGDRIIVDGHLFRRNNFLSEVYSLRVEFEYLKKAIRSSLKLGQKVFTPDSFFEGGGD